MRFTHLEMIKGLKGFGYHDVLELPVVENTARESELTASLRQAMAAYPRAPCVLVRRHGVYVWGDSWAQAKTQAEARRPAGGGGLRGWTNFLCSRHVRAQPPLPGSACTTYSARRWRRAGWGCAWTARRLRLRRPPTPMARSAGCHRPRRRPRRRRAARSH